MKIAYLLDDCPPESFGGAGIVAFGQIKAVAAVGHEVLVLTTTGDRSRVGTSVYEGVRIVRIYSDYHERWQAYLSLYNPQTVPKVVRILAAERPDVVHAHNIHRSISYAALLAARRYSQAVCMTVRDAMTVEYGKLWPRDPLTPGGYDYRISVWKQMREYRWRYNPLRNLCIKFVLSRIDALYTPSRALADGLEQNGVKVTCVVEEGIEPDVLHPNPAAVEDFKERYALRGKKVLFFGGRVSTAKGALAALDLLKSLIATVPETVLLVAGRKDEYMEYLMREADARGVEQAVIPTGWLDREGMAAAYAVADLVLVLSIYLDPFPTINLEAMSLSRPLVGTVFGGTREAVKDGVTGIIVNPYCISASVPRVAALLADRDMLREYGDAGRKRLLERFDVAAASQKLEKEYERITGFL